METTVKLLKHSSLKDISAKAIKKLSQFQAIEATISKSLPPQFRNCFSILNCENNILIIEVNTVWLTWIKGQELAILQSLNKAYGIEKIKWRNNPNPKNEIIKPKNSIRISEKSSKLLKNVAISLKNKKLSEALMKLATRTK